MGQDMLTNSIQHPAFSDDIDRQLDVAIEKLKLSSDGTRAYGWNRKSAGCRVLDNAQEARWLRVQGRSKMDASGKLWHGLQDSGQLNVERKPHLKAVMEWEAAERVWRAELMTFISFKVCSATPELNAPVSLNAKWFDDLIKTLSSLSRHETERINVRQDLVTRRLQERFGEKINPTVSQWVTAHGDLHWANLTQPECWILDWESWGRAPLGMDAALLYFHSLTQPETARQVYEAFQQVLMSPDGVRSQLFVCAELMRMTDLYGHQPKLYAYLKQLSASLIKIAPK